MLKAYASEMTGGSNTPEELATGRANKRRQAYHAFLHDLTKRRVSKEGRFYRVHFVTGRKVDLVPPGSLAGGLWWPTNAPSRAGGL